LTTKIPVFKAGDFFADRFNIIKYLGTGSLASTYLIRDNKGNDEELVLKIIHGHCSKWAGFTAAFIMLTKSVIPIKNGNICKVREAGRHKNRVFYLMDFICETTFRTWLVKTVTFEDRVVNGLNYAKKLVSAMSILHDHGHYACTKPENIYIRENDLIISDYWIPALIPPSELETNFAARQYLDYLAPEVRNDWSSLSQASDFYSAGVILYEILTGRPPFGEYQPPSASSSFYTAETDDIVGKALALKPADRYASAAELIQAVDVLISAFSSEIEGAKQAEVESDTAEVEARKKAEEDARKNAE